ncbi:branched-chain amino acid ABC transporter, periplasmic branched-chain amino acid-binding protein [Paraburkholderia xenovorans LB400]|uniref:Amino acid/amide ABC transporter substrate-binding protein, HAAT family n=1 Tax=Paraburkholderia xenovorans (strain LB400) TaxID=266265 RepID=Q13HM4_PARXL|nr:ABC transporter substrate-binding protein [Paraburkholderia xenovorans]ABE36415.1 amino acid/amide ABC transporter substrate-binding protein, HAAT family [Paraburkholderia xenovorans LB400]AIP34465.1 branched-chain amino acid ABC transporter, periplasmic branched-chain amino acid-binding protein [Paraburkholderia xenovorans LB400]
MIYGIRNAIAALMLGVTFPCMAQISENVIRIGVLTDLSGPYMDVDGPGGVEAIRMAIADAGGTIDGRRIELLVADHQNRTDLAVSKAREWIDTRGVDVIFAGGASAAVLGMAQVAKEKKKPLIVNGAGSARLTNEDCSPYTVHYAYDTVALAKVGGAALVRQGLKSWFFVALDTAFGASTVSDTSEVLRANGGKVIGVVRHPVNLPDFSSIMLQAQGSGAQVLALANAGSDAVNAIKSAKEFGVMRSMKVAGLNLFIGDVYSFGLPTAQGLYLTENWYWDISPESRAWSKRFFEKMKKMPAGTQAAQYSAASHYLAAVKETRSDDGDKVMAAMKSMPINDMYAKNGRIRADGRMIHEMYLMQVKTPAESHYPWDYYRIAERVPAEEAFTTKAQSKCPLWK